MVAPLLAALVPDLFGLVKDVFDRAFPDQAERAKAEMEYQQKIYDRINQIDLAQIAVNQEEAKSDSLFTRGPRPFIMWVCGVAFAYKFIIQPFLIFALVACGSKFDYHALPVLDWTEMSSVLLGLLGLSGMRSMEKMRKV